MSVIVKGFGYRQTVLAKGFTALWPEIVTKVLHVMSLVNNLLSLKSLRKQKGDFDEPRKRNMGP